MQGVFETFCKFFCVGRLDAFVLILRDHAPLPAGVHGVLPLNGDVLAGDLAAVCPGEEGGGSAGGGAGIHR